MRPTRSPFRHLAAFVACALFVGAAWVILTPPAQTFALVAFDAEGNEYVLDYGLTHEDCASAAPVALGDRFEAIDCELEG